LKYIIIEVQEVTIMRRWRHIVEADSVEDAREQWACGLAELVSDGDNIGDEDYGKSGVAVAPADENGEPPAGTDWTDLAFEDFHSRV